MTVLLKPPPECQLCPTTLHPDYQPRAVVHAYGHWMCAQCWFVYESVLEEAPYEQMRYSQRRRTKAFQRKQFAKNLGRVPS